MNLSVFQLTDEVVAKDTNRRNSYACINEGGNCDPDNEKGNKGIHF